MDKNESQPMLVKFAHDVYSGVSLSLCRFPLAVHRIDCIYTSPRQDVHSCKPQLPGHLRGMETPIIQTMEASLTTLTVCTLVPLLPSPGRSHHLKHSLLRTSWETLLCRRFRALLTTTIHGAAVHCRGLRKAIQLLSAARFLPK